MELNAAKQLYFSTYRKLVELGMHPSVASKRVRNGKIFTKLLHDKFECNDVNSLVKHLLEQ
jgi:hypothetical protein